MAKKLTFTLLGTALLVAGCAVFPDSNDVSHVPTAPQRATAQSSQSQTVLVGAKVKAPVTGQIQTRANCPPPAGWVLYQLRLNETIYSLALRANIAARDVLKANCVDDASDLHAGSWLYVPPQATNAQPQTLLPLGISALVVDPEAVPAGGTVNLTWQTQGPVVRVRLGWVYGSQFVQVADSLPSIGTWPVQVPTDGRETITFMLRVSDGVSEVAAQTTVRVACPESWFFGPSPTGCPYPPLVTTFREQHFERGTMVYVPALGVSYLLIFDQPAYQIDDTFAPGMPLTDPALEANIPPGLHQPSGPINYAWRSDTKLMAALGYAVSDEVRYTGMLQRAVSAGGETVYFSASSGTIYRFVHGQPWQIIVPQ
jgi:hypothetical protein